MAHDESSTPLQTMSYWKAVMPRIVSRSAGFRDRNFSRVKFGMEKGLCEKSMRFSSSFHSYIGKSTIQQNSKTSLRVSTNSLPVLSLAWPASEPQRAHLEAEEDTTYPPLLTDLAGNCRIASNA